MSAQPVAPRARRQRDCRMEKLRVIDRHACAFRHRGCTAGERVLIHMQPASTTRQARPVSIAIGAQASLEGDLAVPASPRGLLIFAHPDATERLTAGTPLLADALDERDIATVVVDLLTEAEEAIDQRTGK